MPDRPTLLQVHGALSALVHAVQLTLHPLLVEVEAHWRPGIYLYVTVGVRAKFKQQVIDALMHGALVENYDYRFSLAYPTMPEEPDDWVVVQAFPDMHHPRKDC